MVNLSGCRASETRQGFQRATSATDCASGETGCQQDQQAAVPRFRRHHWEEEGRYHRESQCRAVLSVDS